MVNLAKLETLPLPPSADPEALVRGLFGGLGRLSPSLAARLATQIFFRPPRPERPPWERAIAARGAPIELKHGIVGHVFGRGEVKVLLVHGWGGRGTQLGRFIEPLVARGFKVFAIDGPAHGDSAGRETDASRFADALVTIGGELGPFRAVIGHSFGGTASVIATPRGLPTERLVLIASPSNVLGVFERFCARVGLPESAQRAFARQVRARVGLEPEAVSPRSLAPKIERKALIIHSRDDDEVPFEDAVENAAAWPGAELVGVDGLGHRRVLKDEALIARVVDFVS